jgi:hypothetical protein
MTFVVQTGFKTTTVYDIVIGALRLLQVVSPDVTIGDEEANDALSALNMMVDSFSNESLILHHITQETFTLTPNLAVHRIGVGGEFDTQRPLSIEAATINISGTDWPIKLFSYDDWAVIRLKTLNSNYTQYLYMDDTYPMANVYLYPIAPTANLITLYSKKILTAFSSLQSQVILPPGYERLLKYNLAVELSSEYQTDPGPNVEKLALAAKANIKRTNHRPLTKQVDPALLGPSGGLRFNIYRGN